MEELKDVFFESEDTPVIIATKTVMLFAGSSELKSKLTKLDITYTKVYKGLLTFYCLKGRGIEGTLRIRL